MENIKLCGFFICDQSPTRLVDVDPCLIDLNTDDDVLTEFTENIETDGDISNGFRLHIHERDRFEGANHFDVASKSEVLGTIVLVL
mmetsp:Transcript_6863/g.12251  ORF Transcript_6863/g.12251 Transcript_6863/m.12251 type:complete len:86 (-) Transcript_6863:105-362(-)